MPVGKVLLCTVLSICVVIGGNARVSHGPRPVPVNLGDAEGNVRFAVDPPAAPITDRLINTQR